MMTTLRRLLAVTLTGAAFALLGLTGPAAAQQPHPWELGFQKPHSPVEQGIHSLHNLVLGLMVAVTVFVAGLLLYVAWRYHHTRSPKASRTSHHTSLEIAWTVLPVLILVVIAIPSFRLIYFEDRTENADMTIKVIGHQWYWEYNYPDQGNIKFASNMIPADDIKEGQIRQLSVDNQLVLPAGKNVRILTTSGDVIHSFFIPSLGVQRYAIPGRTIETWVKVDQPGDYYGECNQICGTNHSAMPIAVHALNDADFAAWVEQAKIKFTAAAQPARPGQDVRVASVVETQR